MSIGEGGSLYTVAQGDTLSSIAQKFYGDQNLWQEVYHANTQVIGNNPSLLAPGMQLFILNNPQTAQVYMTAQNCTVTVASLQVRDRPTTKSASVASYPRGTVLNFIEVRDSEIVDNNPRWGHSTQGHYFWLGGTNRPEG